MHRIELSWIVAPRQRPTDGRAQHQRFEASVVSALKIASIVFVCALGGALLGAVLCRVLPKHHLGPDSKDVVKMGMGLLATMSALVLGLMIASAKSSYDAQRLGLEQFAANLVLLDSALARYGPETQDARAALRGAVTSALERIGGPNTSSSSTLSDASTTASAVMLYDKIQGLSPNTDAQRWVQSQALQITIELGRTRWQLLAGVEDGSIPGPFLVILAFWLTVLFASFGLFAPANATVIGTLVVCAASVSGAIFLILELDQPFGGLIQVSAGPLRSAVAHLAQ